MSSLIQLVHISRNLAKFPGISLNTSTSNIQKSVLLAVATLWYFWFFGYQSNPKFQKHPYDRVLMLCEALKLFLLLFAPFYSFLLLLQMMILRWYFILIKKDKVINRNICFLDVVLKNLFNKLKKKQISFGKEFSMFKDNILKRMLLIYYF